MKAVVIHQPYAWAIVRGVKRFENRSWATAFRGRLAVVAGKSRASLGDWGDWNPAVMVDLPRWPDLPFGAVVGTVDLVDCLTLDAAERYAAERCPEQDEFASGPFCWLLANPLALPKPIPVTGRLGLFDIPFDLG